MAHLEKFPDSAVANQLRHNNRQIKNNSNKDIDPGRSHLNVTFTQHPNMSDYEYYKKRKSELYCYNRADVKTMAGWIVTAPECLSSRKDELKFFEHTYHFLLERYGANNCINATVHYDEGIAAPLLNRWRQLVADKNGNIQEMVVAGRPHLHFNFIPVADHKNQKHPQSEKICANEVLTRRDLQTFHPDLKAYLSARNCPGADGVINGKTKSQGRNYTVEELKERYKIEQEMVRLYEVERKYNLEHQHTHERGRW